MTHVQRYSLCPRGEGSWEKLFALATAFAEKKEATLFDLGEETQRDLSKMRGGRGSTALHRTGGDLVVLTISKPQTFRVSIGNLGLKEKAALAIRYWDVAGKDPDLDLLLADIDRFWMVEAVDGSVLDYPPCP